ncbi:MAG: rRNA pseudouridine synthase [Desulfuromonadales bacterium]|nr:rRNA pseudouridine synthase [Desulfuromonadales bacterium]
MEERLQKILSKAGISSRRAAESLITEGRVTVNEEIVTLLGSKADIEKDKIAVDGKPVIFPKRKIYLLLNKPAGYMTTLSDPDGRPIVTDLLKNIPERVFPVGRLDFNTEGLLLLTNDGEWGNRLAHPSNEIEKEYYVKVRGLVTKENITTLTNGVKLDDGWTAPAKVVVNAVLAKSTWISITIHEGRYRQVRRMCEAVGLPVVKLSRIKYGNITIEGMKPGEYRFLTVAEAASLIDSGRNVYKNKR